ncbi:DUF4097 domain-containing protein [Streptomyces sp. SCSIO ZS0520]|uniref:DUF4097 domain-containing protein n=1 Tax=Streptomyces sp. SCSIO ZS0520 TaxID=2892996 RepID=UPI0021DAEB24|nr:DUF4097 domain-containing protein [Streptomyces sp. SCSIO ZS0520]
MHAQSHRARFRRTSLVLTATGVAAATALLSGCGAQASSDKTPERRAFALQGKTLTIDSDDSALELVPADVDKVRVTRWFEGSVVLGGDPKVTWSMKDDRLSLHMKCSGVIADCAAKHRVEIPRDVAVKVSNSDGSVRAVGFRTSLSVKTSDGGIYVRDSTGALDLRSHDGSVRGEGIRSRQIKADTHDGSVDLGLRTVPDRVDAKSHDGSVTLGLPTRGAGTGGGKIAYRLDTGAHDGSVDVAVPRDDRSAHRVSAHSWDGKVTVRSAN